jgi:hypothetical protein
MGAQVGSREGAHSPTDSSNVAEAVDRTARRRMRSSASCAISAWPSMVEDHGIPSPVQVTSLPGMR